MAAPAGPLTLSLPSGQKGLFGAFRSWLRLLGFLPFLVKAAQRDDGPHRFYDPEGPSALEKAIGRGQSTRKGKGQYEPQTALLKRIANQHGRDGKETKQGQSVHPLNIPSLGQAAPRLNEIERS